MEEHKKEEETEAPRGLGRLLKSMQRRRSMLVTRSSREVAKEEEAAPGADESSEAGKKLPAPPAGLRRAKSAAHVRDRAGTAQGRLQKKEEEKAVEENEDEEKARLPEKARQLPRSVRGALRSTTATTAQLEDNWTTALFALRAVVDRELRRLPCFEELPVSASLSSTSAPPPDPEPEYEQVAAEKKVKRVLKVGEKIGQGSYGAVYLARTRENGQCAVKKISNIGSRHAARNAREVGHLQQCHHANILTVYHCYLAQDSQSIWLVMELLQGGALDEALRLAGPVPPKETARCAADLLAALSYLHARGVAHRDLKPGNAMLALAPKGKSAHVKLVDFSLAGELPKDGVVSTMGTLAFFPPEMTLRQPHHLSCDVWSLGIFVITLLEGEVPRKESAFDMLFLSAIGQPPKVRSRKGIPKLAHQFVAACLVVDPAERPTADELATHPWIETAAHPEEMWRLVKSVFRQSALEDVIGAF